MKAQTESYKDVVAGLKELNVGSSSIKNKKATTKVELCPYAAQGECPYQESCQYTHGDACDLCGEYCT